MISNLNDFREALQPFSLQPTFSSALTSIELNIIPTIYNTNNDLADITNTEKLLGKVFPYSRFDLTFNNEVVIFSPTVGFWKCDISLMHITLDDFRTKFYREFLSRFAELSRFDKFYWAVSAGVNSVRVFKAEETKVVVHPNWLYVYISDNDIADDEFVKDLMSDVYNLRQYKKNYFRYHERFKVINDNNLYWLDFAGMLPIGCPARGYFTTTTNSHIVLITDKGHIISDDRNSRIFNNINDMRGSI